MLYLRKLQCTRSDTNQSRPLRTMTSPVVRIILTVIVVVIGSFRPSPTSCLPTPTSDGDDPAVSATNHPATEREATGKVTNRSNHGHRNMVVLNDTLVTNVTEQFQTPRHSDAESILHPPVSGEETFQSAFVMLVKPTNFEHRKTVAIETNPVTSLRKSQVNASELVNSAVDGNNTRKTDDIQFSSQKCRTTSKPCTVEVSGRNSHFLSNSIIDSRLSGKRNLSSTATTGLNSSRYIEIIQGSRWSYNLEKSCHRDFYSKTEASWRSKLHGGISVVGMQRGCGRMQNRKLTLQDGSYACARYRVNKDQLQGEIYTYYLSKLLDISAKIPPTVLLAVNTSSPQWRDVHMSLSLAHWSNGWPVVITQWMSNLSPAYIPKEFRINEFSPTDHRANLCCLTEKTNTELCELIQWSDLIVLDFLTANLDRLVNNMFNMRWNADILSNPAHNLERFPTGDLLLFDNESGLFHGYRLLDKYYNYHEAILSSWCLFRRSTVRAIAKFFRTGQVGNKLQRLFLDNEPYHTFLPPISHENIVILNNRIAKLYHHIRNCESFV